MPFISSSGNMYRLDGPQRRVNSSTAKVVLFALAILLTFVAIGRLSAMTQHAMAQKWRPSVQSPILASAKQARLQAESQSELSATEAHSANVPEAINQTRR